MRASDELMGDVALRTTGDEPAQGELGFSFARLHQGHGYATEAASTVVSYAFETLGMSRIFAITDRRNSDAHRLLARLGFALRHELDGGACVYDRRRDGPTGTHAS